MNSYRGQCQNCDQGILTKFLLGQGFYSHCFLCPCDAWRYNLYFWTKANRDTGSPPSSLPHWVVFDPGVHVKYVDKAPTDSQLVKWFEANDFKNQDFLKAKEHFPGREYIAKKYQEWQQGKAQAADAKTKGDDRGTSQGGVNPVSS